MGIPYSDSLRTVDNICSDDPRQQVFVHHDGRPVTLSDQYASIAEIKLNKWVPDAVTIHFETARNLLLYSRFVYRFTPVAELQAYTTVEFALKEKAALCDKGRQRMSLRTLLRLAIKEGWIKDEDFPSYKRIEKVRSEYLMRIEEISGFKSDQQEREDLQKYCRIIGANLPSLRNTLAHGEPYLNTPGNAIGTLEICAELINQLWKEE